MPDFSTNQLAVTVTKACLGAGVARGVADDLGAAMAGLAGNKDRLSSTLSDLLAALADFDAQMVPELDLSHDSHGGLVRIRGDAKVLFHGPGLVDYGLMLAGQAGVMIPQIDHPSLLLALVEAAPLSGSVSRKHSGALFVTFTRQQRDLTHVPRRAELTLEQWDALNLYAHATMVPTDAASLADAGAGTSDND